MEENNLSAIHRLALSVIDSIREKILKGDCNEQDLTESLSQFHPEANGYFKRTEYINADKAMNILQLGHNRGKFYSLLREYGIKNYKLNNMPMGYRRCEIERLARIIKVEHQANRSRNKYTKIKL